MENVNFFQNYLRKFIDITDDEFNRYLLPVIKVRKFGKKEQVTRAGEVENYINFITKGLVRKYYRKGNQEINTQIYFEEHFIIRQESFHSRLPSAYYIEIIEPTIF